MTRDSWTQFRSNHGHSTSKCDSRATIAEKFGYIALLCSNLLFISIQRRLPSAAAATVAAAGERAVHTCTVMDAGNKPQLVAIHVSIP